MQSGERASLITQLMRITCNAADSGSIPGLERSPGEGIGCPLQSSWASLVAQLVKNPPRNAGDLGSMPGWGRFPCGGHSNPLQYSCLENPIDGGTWRATGHGVAESHTTKRLSTAQLGLIIKNKKETTKNPTATPEEPGAKAGHCTCNLH